LRLFSFGGYGLALAALALVVFGAYDSYPTLLAMGKKETPYVLYKLATLFLPKNWPDVCLQRHATSGEGMGGGIGRRAKRRWN